MTDAVTVHDQRSTRPVVSAIIVYRDGERFLAEAIASVREQAFDDCELILVDDGSTDGSAEIARAAWTDDPRRTVLAEFPGTVGHGISAARNLGLITARGRYVAFLDADDIWKREKLAEQVRILDADPTVGLTYGRVLMWYDWDGNDTGRDFYYDLGLPTGEAIRDYRPLLQLLENKFQTPTTSGSMFRRDIAIAEGGCETKLHGMFEDVPLFTKLMAVSATFVSDRCLALYRQHQHNLSSRQSAFEELEARLICIDSVVRFLGEKAITDERLWRVLACERRRTRKALHRQRLKSLILR